MPSDLVQVITFLLQHCQSVQWFSDHCIDVVNVELVLGYIVAVCLDALVWVTARAVYPPCKMSLSVVKFRVM